LYGTKLTAKLRLLLWTRIAQGSLCILLSLAFALQAYGQDQTDAPSDDPSVTLFPHSQTSRYWISGQDNIIFQWHPSFDATYSGTNSFRSTAEHATSNVATIFLGYQLTRTTEIFGDAESAAGGGLSDALGLAGFVNVDVVRNPELGPSPYLARAMIRQIIPLSSEMVESERGPFALATSLPVRRFELRAGKFGMADFFDLNDSGSDSHSQFMNWTVDNNGAYDYAADTRGYTVGVIVEYHDRNWAFRFGESLMPKVANGPDLDWNLRRARAENYELELHPHLTSNHTTTVRLLSYVNHANMGVYRQAINGFLQGRTPRPEIRAHPLQTTIKYGFGVNIEQELSHQVRGFARWGWNEGQHESYAYTEVDQTIEVGADVAGNAWHRGLDKLGGVFVSNGISADHQKYLSLGGLGFLIGDGALNYGRENIVECYYNAHIWRGIFAGVDLQHVNHPGYNRDRGPVLAPGFRFHLDF
jgi:high affinity Mn2+ porin